MQLQASRTNVRFSKIPRFYYWFFGGVLPALFSVVITYNSHYFVVNATGLLWVFTVSIITAVYTIVLASISVCVLLFGIMISLVIKDRNERIEQKQLRLIRNEIQSFERQSETRKITKQEQDDFILRLKDIVDSIPDESQDNNIIDLTKIDLAVTKADEALNQTRNLSDDVSDLHQQVDELKKWKSEQEQLISKKALSQTNDENTETKNDK
jgi:hypothetical protein